MLRREFLAMCGVAVVTPRFVSRDVTKKPPSQLVISHGIRFPASAGHYVIDSGLLGHEILGEEVDCEWKGWRPMAKDFHEGYDYDDPFSDRFRSIVAASLEGKSGYSFGPELFLRVNGKYNAKWFCGRRTCTHLLPHLYSGERHFHLGTEQRGKIFIPRLITKCRTI